MKQVSGNNSRVGMCSQVIICSSTRMLDHKSIVVKTKYSICSDFRARSLYTNQVFFFFFFFDHGVIPPPPPPPKKKMYIVMHQRVMVYLSKNHDVIFTPKPGLK